MYTKESHRVQRIWYHHFTSQPTMNCYSCRPTCRVLVSLSLQCVRTLSEQNVHTKIVMEGVKSVVGDASSSLVLYHPNSRWDNFRGLVTSKLQANGNTLVSSDDVDKDPSLLQNIVGIVTWGRMCGEVNTLIPVLPRLKTISSQTTSYGELDLELCARRGLSVGTTSVATRAAVADMALTLLLASARSLKQGMFH